MIKYNFKVEESFKDKTNNKKYIKKDTILVVTEERLQELNDAKVGRVISAEYVEDKDGKTPTKNTKGRKNNKEEETEIPEGTNAEEETEETE